jgi:putative tryptophan/tyrosine transport system substrate-binding protein
MRRREFITLLGATAAWPLAAHAQSADRIARVGVLGPDPNNNPVTAPGYQVFLSELRKLGFTEGHNLVVQYRRTDEGLPKAFTGANEMVAAKADVLVANGPEVALQAAAAARPAVPIVMLRAITTRSSAATSRALPSPAAMSPVCSTASRSWP